MQGKRYHLWRICLVTYVNQLECYSRFFAYEKQLQSTTRPEIKSLHALSGGYSYRFLTAITLVDSCVTETVAQEHCH